MTKRVEAHPTSANEKQKELFSLLHCAAINFTVAYHPEWKPPYQVSRACGGCAGEEYCARVKAIAQEFCNHGSS